MIGLYTYTFTILENRAFFEKILCNPYVYVKGTIFFFSSAATLWAYGKTTEQESTSRL